MALITIVSESLLCRLHGCILATVRPEGLRSGGPRVGGGADLAAGARSAAGVRCGAPCPPPPRPGAAVGVQFPRLAGDGGVRSFVRFIFNANVM